MISSDWFGFGLALQKKAKMKRSATLFHSDCTQDKTREVIIQCKFDDNNNNNEDEPFYAMCKENKGETQFKLIYMNTIFTVNRKNVNYIKAQLKNSHSSGANQVPLKIFCGVQKEYKGRRRKRRKGD